MSKDDWKAKREEKLQQAADQLRNILRAKDADSRKQACNKLIEDAGSLKQDLDMLFTQLVVVAKESHQHILEEKLRKLWKEADLEMLAMEAVYEGFPYDWPSEG